MNIFNLNTDPEKVYSALESEKSIFKIVLKTKNEVFFIEKWIIHHLNILQDAKLIIFDNMSDDEYIHNIYEKYQDNIILIKFNWYMDCLHIVNYSKNIYKALSASSKFFTIIDTDEYLYLYDGNKVINDNSIVKFLEENTDCNFFVPAYLNNITNSENFFSLDYQNLSILHCSKPIINTKLYQIFESSLAKYKYPTLGHTQFLPISAYGKTKIRFLLLHLKNLNKYQRINANMMKLVSLNIVKNNKDFFSILKIDIDNFDTNTIPGRQGRAYVIETRKLIESILCIDEKSTDLSKDARIKFHDDGTLAFTPESYEKDFLNLLDSDYFDLIQFNSDKIDMNQYTTIYSYIKNS
jgi:hypothetical protein